LKGDRKLGYGFTLVDELEEINIGPGVKPCPTFISKRLDPSLWEPMIALLKEYSDCFAWDYTEMPFQQRVRQMRTKVLEAVKKEIERMLKVGFIRPCRYVEWISSIGPIQKKDGWWWVCVDFRDLNRATSTDEYPIPVVEMLINAVANNKILSFVDGNAGYNQIFMAPEDIHKTAFRVPDVVG
jgi:hypothetical protein